MPHDLKNVVPWGRSMAEYERMFNLGEADLPKKILGCGDGPACFNAEWTARGGRVISLDPLYRFSSAEIRARIDEVTPAVIRLAEQNRETYVWREFDGPRAMADCRLRSMARFLEDYEAGKRAGRYMEAALPELPFPDGHFDLALVSHLLFTYSDVLDFDFHIAALRELLRVAREARVYPLANMTGEPSPFLPGVIGALRESGFEAGQIGVPYEFQRGARHLLRVRAKAE